MGRQVAIVIGVESYPTLQPLPGARTDAQDVADWAASAGYDVQLFVDDSARLRAEHVVGAVESAVEAGDVDRLLIFFSGHGIAQGVGVDYWLLPQAHRRPAEAVNVLSTVEFARYCGIEHVVIVADACRTVDGKLTLQVSGQPIMPPPDYSLPHVSRVDSYFATRPGNPAQELDPSFDQQRTKAFGIFTRTLLRALQGQAADAIQLDPDRQDYVVAARLLTGYLEETLPRDCAEAGVPPQRPDARPGSYFPPHHYVRLPPPPSVHITVESDSPGPVPLSVQVAGDAGWQEITAGASPLAVDLAPGSVFRVSAEDEWQVWPPDEAHRHRTAIAGQVVHVKVIPAEAGGPVELPPDNVVRIVDPRSGSYAAVPDHAGDFVIETLNQRTGWRHATVQHLQAGDAPVADPVPAADGVDDPRRTVLAEPGRQGFESGGGLSIVGATITSVHSREPSWSETFEERDAWHATVWSGHPPYEAPPRLEEPTPTLVRVQAPDRWLLTMVAPGYVTTQVIDTHGTSHLRFGPIARSLSIDQRDEEQHVLTSAAQALENGWYEVAVDRDSPVAAYLASHQPVNPTLALLAGYAYLRDGDRDAIARLRDRFTEEHGWVPYDLWVLADRAVGPPPPMVVPDYPLMTATWALLEPAHLSPAVAAIRAVLLPARWTSLAAGSAPPELPRLIEEGDLW